MDFCIRALHLMPNISMKMIEMTFLLTQLCCVCFQSSQAHGSALNLSRFYFFIKNFNIFYQFCFVSQKCVVLTEKALLFQEKPLLICLNSLLKNQFRVGPISWLTLDVFLE